MLYMRAQEFIQQSDDSEKIRQLLDLLDEEKRSILLEQYKEKTQMMQRKMINYTQESYKKYDNIKI